MDKKKTILIVILALIVAAYVFFVVWGATSDDNKGNNKAVPKKTPVTADNYEPSPSMSNFGGLMGDWFGRFLPKSGITCAIKAPEGSKITCEALKVNGSIDIPPRKGTSFRIATLILKEGGADIEYDDSTDAADDAEMDEQDFSLPDKKDSSRKQNSLVIFEDGGSLTITCKDNKSCRVALQ